MIDGQNGFITPPRPEALAEVMDRLYYDRNLARRMGISARERVAALEIGWDQVVKKLLQ